MDAETVSLDEACSKAWDAIFVYTQRTDKLKQHKLNDFGEIIDSNMIMLHRIEAGRTLLKDVKVGSGNILLIYDSIRTYESDFKSYNPNGTVVWSNMEAPYSVVPPTSGIYALTEVTSGRAYVGQSRDLASRLLAHRTAIEFGGHDNYKIAEVLAEGKRDWKVEVLELCGVEALNAREQHWCEVFAAHEVGFNIATIPRSS